MPRTLKKKFFFSFFKFQVGERRRAECTHTKPDSNPEPGAGSGKTKPRKRKPLGRSLALSPLETLRQTVPPRPLSLAPRGNSGQRCNHRVLSLAPTGPCRDAPLPRPGTPREQGRGCRGAPSADVGTGLARKRQARPPSTPRFITAPLPGPWDPVNFPRHRAASPRHPTDSPPRAAPGIARPRALGTHQTKSLLLSS